MWRKEMDINVTNDINVTKFSFPNNKVFLSKFAICVQFLLNQKNNAKHWVAIYLVQKRSRSQPRHYFQNTIVWTFGKEARRNNNTRGRCVIVDILFLYCTNFPKLAGLSTPPPPYQFLLFLLSSPLSSTTVSLSVVTPLPSPVPAATPYCPTIFYPVSQLRTNIQFLHFALSDSSLLPSSHSDYGQGYCCYKKNQDSIWNSGFVYECWCNFKTDF